MIKIISIIFITFISLSHKCYSNGVDILGEYPDKQTFKEEQDVLKSALQDGALVLLESEFISRKRPESDHGENTDNQTPHEHLNDHSNEHVNENNEEIITDKEEKKLHKEAEITAEHMLRKRDGELAPIPKKDGTLHTTWKLIFHILYSRAGKWEFINPTEMHLVDVKPGHHKLIKSTPKHVDNNIPFPEQHIYSISNIPEEFPNKNGKTPVLLFGMEAFVIFRLINQAMLEIVNSKDPVEEKVLFTEEWVHFVTHHFFLFFPYNVITAKRCTRLLSESTTDVELLEVCRKMHENAQNSDTLEAFLMIDPENNGDLLEKCVREKHIIPSYMKLNHKKLSHLHLKHNLAMELSDFVTEYGMVTANAEQEILKDERLQDPKFWGANCTKDEAINAENEIVKLFSTVQKELNDVITRTFQNLLELVEKNKGKASPGKGLLKAEKREFEAAKKEMETNDELKKNIEEARTQFLKYAEKGSSGGEELVKELAKNELEDWKTSVSAHILDTMKTSCKDDPVFCFSAIEHCRVSLEELENDTEQHKIIEKLHRALSAALLKSGKLTEEDYVKELSRYIKHDQEELNGDKPQQPAMIQVCMKSIKKHKCNF